MSDAPIKILLIEDNPGDARLVREMLIKAGDSRFNLVHADTLSKGLNQLANDNFMVILTDLNLPDSSGLESIIHIREHIPNIPVIALTGAFDETLGMAAVQAGAQDYLLKDLINSNMLVRVILFTLERWKLVKELKDALVTVKNLQGLLPICAHCKKIRDDEGYWKQVETYIEEHSEAKFTHGICPECRKLLYPDLYVKEQKDSTIEDTTDDK